MRMCSANQSTQSNLGIVRPGGRLVLWTIFALIVVLFQATSLGQAQEASEWSRAQGLTLVGSRAAGLAGAFTAVADNTDTVYWNPAGLERLTGTEASLSYQIHDEENPIQMNLSLLAGRRGEGGGGEGLGVLISEIEVPGESEEGTNGEEELEKVKIKQRVVILSKSFRDKQTGLSFGVSLKYLNEKIEKTEHAAGADVGLLYRFGNYLSVGLVARNVTTVFDDVDSFEDEYQIGLAGSPIPSLTLSGDVTNFLGQDDQPKTFRGGIRYQPLDMLTLRGGYMGIDPEEGDSESVVTGGISLFDIRKGAGRQLGLDYAVTYNVDAEEAELTHTISATARW